MLGVPDEPHFPAPRPKGYRDSEPAAPSAAEPARKIVTRAEPPPDLDAPKPKLTREEMNAMIAVTAAQHPPWKKSLKRSPILLPATIASHWSMPLAAVLVIAALVWIARPLFRRDGFSSR
jgi:hypothetical protein